MKDILRYKGFWGSIEISINDSCIHGKLLFIDDLITYEAKSVEQIQVEFKNAVDDYLETCKELGREPLRPFSGTFNVRIGSNLHQTLAQYAVANESSINDVVKKALNQYLNGMEQKEIIHTHKHIHHFSDEKHISYEQDFTFGEEDKQWLKKPIVKVLN